MELAFDVGLFILVIIMVALVSEKYLSKVIVGFAHGFCQLL